MARPLNTDNAVQLVTRLGPQSPPGVEGRGIECCLSRTMRASRKQRRH